MLPFKMPKKFEEMGFAARLLALRKQRGMSQVTLAEAVGVHVTQLRRYEAGRSQPTLEVLRQLAKALRVSADLLLFAEGERGPDEDFRFQFEALAALGQEERKVVKAVLDALLLQHDAKRWASA